MKTVHNRENSYYIRVFQGVVTNVQVRYMSDRVLFYATPDGVKRGPYMRGSEKALALLRTWSVTGAQSEMSWRYLNVGF